MLLYVENDGTLYCSENGSKGKEIAANIFDLTVYRGTATYFTDINNYDGVACVFYLNDENSFEDLAVGKKFKQLQYFRNHFYHGIFLLLPLAVTFIRQSG